MYWAALVVAAAVVDGGLHCAAGPGPRAPACLRSALPLSTRLRGGCAGDTDTPPAPGRTRPGRRGGRTKKRR